jgi:hypothetical protein
MAAGESIVVEVSSDRSHVLQNAFSLDNQGHICFGMAARSSNSKKMADLFEGQVEFIDYVMEGFVTYQLQLRERPNCVVFELTKSGTNRDQYLESHLRWYLRILGLDHTVN